MPLSHAQRVMSTFVAAVLVAGLALALPAPAAAAQPKEGKFRYVIPDPTNPPAITDGIFFTVGESNNKLLVLGGTAWISDVCGRYIVPSSVPISAKGKAKFKGMAEESPGTGSLKIKLKIKFTGKRRATVTVKDLDPNVDCGALVGVTAKYYT